MFLDKDCGDGIDAVVEDMFEMPRGTLLTAVVDDDGPDGCECPEFEPVNAYSEHEEGHPDFVEAILDGQLAESDSTDEDLQLHSGKIVTVDLK